MTNGTGLRVYHLTTRLCAMGDDVAVLSDCQDGEYPQAYRQAGVTVVEARCVGSLRRSRWDVFDHNPGLAEELARQAGQREVIVLSGPAALQYGRFARGALVVADMIDDPVLAMKRNLWSGASPVGWLRRMRTLLELKRYERKELGPVQAVFFVSDADSNHFRRTTGYRTVITSHNGVDLEYFEPVAYSPSGSEEEVLFVGNMAFKSNVIAAEVLIKRVAPRVWRYRPGVRFRIVGPHPPLALARLAGPRVEITGLVPDIRPFLQSAAVACAPMTTGTGIKNKILEAWAAARAVVATPLACLGLPAEHGRNVLLASGAGRLAEQICLALGDIELRNRLGRQGRDTVERVFTWPLVSRAFRSAVVDIIRSGG
jgi:glycosyltransferase involved in cell wall biosynthesis